MTGHTKENNDIDLALKLRFLSVKRKMLDDILDNWLALVVELHPHPEGSEVQNAIQQAVTRRDYLRK